MRLRAGRPDVAQHAHRFTVPPATTESAVSVTFLGVSTLLLDDGRSALLTDGFFSRPTLRQVIASRLAPDDQRIESVLRRAGIGALEAVMPVHTHFDHALDSARVAELTGARLVGGESALNLGRGHGLPGGRLERAVPGEPHDFGSFRVTHLESHHCPPDRYPGRITTAFKPPARASAYRCGEAWSLIVEHVPSGQRTLIQGSAGHVVGALDGQRAEVAYLGVGQLGLQPRGYLEEYWNQTVASVQASQVVLIHWDDFFRPLDQPLRALPFAGDDLDRTIRVLEELAARDGVRIEFPSVWVAEDPWAERP